MIVPPEVFENNYSNSYGKNLYLQLVPKNIINQNSLIIGKYYGYSGEGIINHLSSQWRTFHIIRYDGIIRGFLNIHCLFSLFYISDILGEQIIHWITGVNNDTVINLNNKIYYELSTDIIRDMIWADKTIPDEEKNERLNQLNERINANSQTETSLTTCTICMTNPLNRVITQCGHTLCCECATNPGFHTCHICRIPINLNNIIPLYIG